MECCVSVSIETVLQVVQFYPVVNEKELKKTDVSDYSRSSQWLYGLQIKRCLYSDVKHDNAMREVCKKQKEIKG